MRWIKRVKQWAKLNKYGVIYLSVFILYTLLMLGVIFVFGGDISVCSQGTLSSQLSGEQASIKMTEPSLADDSGEDNTDATDENVNDGSSEEDTK